MSSARRGPMWDTSAPARGRCGHAAILRLKARRCRGRRDPLHRLAPALRPPQARPLARAHAIDPGADSVRETRTRAPEPGMWLLPAVARRLQFARAPGTGATARLDR